MKQRITYLFALLALGVGLYGVFTELFKPEAPVVVQQQGPIIKKVKVWLATANIQKGQNFNTGLLSSEQRLEEEADFALLDLPYNQGAVFRHNVKSGEMLTQEDLITPDQPDYIDTIISAGMTPFPLAVEQRHIIAAGVQAGDYIDILALTSLQQNMSSSDRVESPRAANIDVKPLLNRVRVLAVQGKTYDDQDLVNYGTDEASTFVTLVLEIPHRFISKMTLARRLSALEIYKSKTNSRIPNAQTKDILPGYQGIVEMRGSRRG
ncbi:Flp pilus assembly protein CpaB [Photobacterium sanguinicancri]|uniref:Flp pilus assembly protein CpaB n=1 Tax=Photobacterium sanguinicancri TaxID=875932 RepID=A0ABX4FRD6_9GAMM|nr:Flp pilus assembly protein CpaB [Photobacterium sanguinicancri]OZS41402.1 Flp pilus assembly protein CpaB [Photobacterium sanguinicancri]